MNNDPAPSASSGEFELADRVVCVIEDHYGYDRLAQWDQEIPLECRVVHFTWMATGFAACEGYVALLMMECEHRALARSLVELGLHDLASAADMMIAPLADKNVLGNKEALEKHFGGWEPFAAWVAPFQRTFFAARERIPPAVASYCRTHAASLAHLSAEVRRLLAR